MCCTHRQTSVQNANISSQEIDNSVFCEYQNCDVGVYLCNFALQFKME